ncbi:MAG: uroporphyrinogen-III synthase [Epsilonproteobacteria bacterium]|nr:uroporphyrinogen-III synthase [Campylobacterota bacterium]
MRSIYLFSISSHKDAIHVNPLEITFFQPNIDFSDINYLILTSKQAVKALQNYDKKEYIDKKALCISKATAKAYEDIGGEVLATGKGYGDTLIAEIQKYPKKIKWLYLRAKIVASDFCTVLKSQGYIIKETIVYESNCSQEILHVNVPKNAILIFTSPSSVKCYLKNHTFLKTQHIIVIGKTTAKTIPEDINYTLSPDTTVQSCIEIAKEAIKNNNLL